MDAFWLDPVDPLDPLQNSGALILKHPSRSFGTFCRKIGTHFDPNLQKSNEKTMFPDIVDIPSIVDIVDTVDTADIVHTVDTLDIVKSVNSCLLYTSPSPRDATLSRMPSSA